MIALNPEIKRYQWLEFSLQRLVVMPLVLGIIFFIAYKADEWKSVAFTAEFIFFTLVFLWGGHKAAESVLEEVQENTWDFQRLSSQSPWNLSWGKLLGAASYCWYGALMALAMYVIAIWDAMSLYHVVRSVFFMLVCGLICHGVSMLSSMLSIANGSLQRGRKAIIGHHLIGLFAGWSILSFKTTLNRVYTVSWYDGTYDMLSFISFFSFVFLIWLMAGIYWQMRVQLRMRSGPWLLVAFTLFTVYFHMGFVEIMLLDERFSMYSELALRAFVICVTFLYVVLFLEPWGTVGYRKFYESWKSRNWIKAADLFPRWVASFILTLASMLWLCLQVKGFEQLLFIVALLAFIVRDITLYHFFKLRPGSRRATLATIFYLGFMYGLIPALLAVLHNKSLLPLFIPVRFEAGDSVLSIISCGAQAAIFGFLSYKRIRNND